MFLKFQPVYSQDGREEGSTGVFDRKRSWSSAALPLSVGCNNGVVGHSLKASSLSKLRCFALRYPNCPKWSDGSQSIAVYFHLIRKVAVVIFSSVSFLQRQQSPVCRKDEGSILRTTTDLFEFLHPTMAFMWLSASFQGLMPTISRLGPPAPVIGWTPCHTWKITTSTATWYFAAYLKLWNQGMRF